MNLKTKRKQSMAVCKDHGHIYALLMDSKDLMTLATGQEVRGLDGVDIIQHSIRGAGKPRLFEKMCLSLDGELFKLKPK